MDAPDAPEATNASASPVTRREAITALGAVGAAAALAPHAFAQNATAQNALAGVGYDPATKRYTLPPLPYAYDALEPAIDAETVRLHHDIHHAGYVKGLNRALDSLDAVRKGIVDTKLVKHWSRELLRVRRARRSMAKPPLRFRAAGRGWRGGTRRRASIWWRRPVPPRRTAPWFGSTCWWRCVCSRCTR